MPTYQSVYRGTVVNAADPMSQKRVQVNCPSVGGQLGWALPCLPPGANAGTNGYGVGDKVWIAFENGDPSYPVVLGKFL
jgi:hypothetical protein